MKGYIQELNRNYYEKINSEKQDNLLELLLSLVVVLEIKVSDVSIWKLIKGKVRTQESLLRSYRPDAVSHTQQKLQL